MKKSKLMQLCIALMGMLIAGPSLAKELPVHNFPYKSECTYFVAQQTFIPFNGNANQWLNNAEKYNFKLYRGNSKADKYAVLQTNESAKYGHVAWITDIDGNNIHIKEKNFAGTGVISQRTLKKGDKRIQGIILTKKSIKEKYEDGYEKYKKYKDDPKKYKKYKDCKDDYETYKELKKRYEDAGIWSDKHL
jgi:hypothetical protein